MIKVRTAGLNRANTLNSIVRKGVHVKNVEYCGELVFSVTAAERKKIRIKSKSENKQGLSSFLYFFTSRGIILGVVLSVVFIVLFSSVTVGVDVIGGGAYSNSISEFVEDMGYSALRRKTGDLSGLDSALLHNFPLSIAESFEIGTRVVVRVKEELPPAQIFDYTDKSALVSAYDCVVSRIVCAQGTKTIDVGRAVKKGGTLIANFIEVGDVREKIRAVGEVYGKVWFSVSSTIGETALVPVRTGKTETVSYMRVFGAGKSPESSFVSAEFEETASKISDILPIYAVYRTYFETQSVVVPVNTEDTTERFFEKGKAILVSENPDVTFSDFRFTSRALGDRIELTVFGEAEILISVRSSSV